MKKPKATKADLKAKPKSQPTSAEIEERIQKRAYELWEQSGRTHGHDLEHWLQARLEITGLGLEKDFPE